MTWNTVNVLGISCAGNTAMKLAWNILNVFAMYRMGFWWVLYPFPCDVLAVYLPGTPALAPSDTALDIISNACPRRPIQLPLVDGSNIRVIRSPIVLGPVPSRCISLGQAPGTTLTEELGVKTACCHWGQRGSYLAGTL